MVLATLTGGGMLRIAAGSTVLVTVAEPGGRAEIPARHGVPARRRCSRPADAGASGRSRTQRRRGSSDGARQRRGQLRPRARPAPRPAAGTAGSPAAAPAVVVPPLPAAPPAVSGPSEEDLALIPAPEGTPESVVEAARRPTPDAVGVLLLAERLAKGINTKSGSCLKDLSDLAHELFIILKDAENALAVADLLNVLPFDGNPGRWASVEASLALSSYICRSSGRRTAPPSTRSSSARPTAMETDPFKARINAKVRQRSLNEPNLYDKEIFRSIDNSNPDAEREWRLLRLESLLFLRAHGGSETIGAQELERRIGNELESVRSWAWRRAGDPFGPTPLRPGVVDSGP